MLFYFVFLPQIFKSKHVHNFVNNIVNKNFGLTFIVENAELETKLKPEIEIEIEKLVLLNKNESLIELNDFEFEFSFANILLK